MQEQSHRPEGRSSHQAIHIIVSRRQVHSVATPTRMRIFCQASPRSPPCAHAKGVSMPSRLYPEDQERVDAYLNQPANRVERRPFNVWLLLGVILGAVVAMGLLARLLASFVVI